jgi:hypothetical protein
MDRRKVASGVSAILNTPLITFATFIPLILTFGAEKSIVLVVISGFFGCVLPLVGVYVTLKKGIIKDFYANDKKTRPIPFLWSIFSYLVGVSMLLIVKSPPAITALMACYFVNGIVLLLFQVRSLH